MPALEKQSTKEFFGGAITCSLPEAYLDARYALFRAKFKLA
jgi:hypothetical protein